MIIFGGVTSSPRGRVADLQTRWLGPPTLFSTALAKMKKITNVVSLQFRSISGIFATKFSFQDG